MSLQIKINSVDKSSLISWQTVKKTETLSKEAATLEFDLFVHSGQTYAPAIGDEVKWYDANGVLIYAGLITEIDTAIDGLLTTYSILALDYMHLADQKLVSRTYLAQTGTQIIQDIFASFASGFTTVNVNAPLTLDKMVFNYLGIVQSLQKLVQAIGGGYDWYIDYAKDVHFFQTGFLTAPFALDDTSGNFIFNTLETKTDMSQLRNVIVVRGGDAAGATVTALKIADGSQIIFFVGYNLTGFLAYQAMAATPTVFVALTVGIDGVDNPASFDALYNADLGLLRFPAAPAVNNVIKYTGIPSYPVLSQVTNPASIALYGTYQYYIVDRTIASQINARNKANAELLQYSVPIVSGKFETIKPGLAIGQVVAINSTIRNISGVFKILRLETSVFEPKGTLYYKVEFVSTLAVTMVDLLNKLLVTDPSTQINLSENPVLDLVISVQETVAIVESLVVSGSHNPINETITIAESTTLQAVNYAVVFVAGPQTPSGFNRQFVLNGSRLG
jgi:hypothetical protein